MFSRDIWHTFNPHERELVTSAPNVPSALRMILIHTSVKLVTKAAGANAPRLMILIHTSVKLVTRRASSIQNWRIYFNPHEREARDRREMSESN